MHAVQSSRRLVSWIAACAILFGALAPTLTHVLARIAASEARVMAICTSTGMKAMVVAGDHGHHRPGKADGLRADHCPYCNTHSASVGLPPPPEAVIVVLRGLHTFLPERFYRAPAPLFAWAPAHPRAPPARA